MSVNWTLMSFVSWPVRKRWPLPVSGSATSVPQAWWSRRAATGCRAAAAPSCANLCREPINGYNHFCQHARSPGAPLPKLQEVLAVDGPHGKWCHTTLSCDHPWKAANTFTFYTSTWLTTGLVLQVWCKACSESICAPLNTPVTWRTCCCYFLTLILECVWSC